MGVGPGLGAGAHPAWGKKPSQGAGAGVPGPGAGRVAGGRQLCNALLPSLVLLKNPSISNFVVRSHPVLPVVFLGSP